MKKSLILAAALFVSLQVTAQNKPTKTPSSLPPGMDLEQIKKMLPPGVNLSPEMIKAMQQAAMQAGQEGQAGEVGEGSGEEQGYAPGTLVPIPPAPQYTYNPEPSGTSDYSPFGSGRDEGARRAALIAVETELNAKPMLLPDPKSVPSREYMLGMASEMNRIARQKFLPADLTDYIAIVNWAPRFDGETPNKTRARELSLAVALATNSFPRPYYNTALATAVFSLDPDSPVAAGNMGSAILSGGEMICEKNPSPAALAPYRRDAESAYLYAIQRSMKDDLWSEASLNPVINLGNLCIDMGRLEEARSLFMVARKIKPESWDAALGLAAYFMALKQKDKALAVLEDDNLDRPLGPGLPIKTSKSLEKSEEFSDLPVEAPESKFEKGIEIMSAEPVMTSADFISQLDQSERNKMRYFIEHLPVQGSYVAPPIKKLTQYSTLKVMSGPQGMSALADFSEMLGVFSLGSFASTTNEQLDWLAGMGLKIDPGVDMNDVAKNPQKYMNQDLDPNVKISGKEEFVAKMKQMGMDANKAKLDLATGDVSSTIAIAGQIDPIHLILQMDPNDYADPMNIVAQKMNYTVYQRKNHLYYGYLFKLNKKTYDQVTEIITQCYRKMEDLAKVRDAETEEFEKRKEAAKARAEASGSTFEEAEWNLIEHNIHMKFFNAANNIQETGFGSATNVVSTTYMQRFKPNVEAYYYDVFRHIAIISDPVVRQKKDADLRNSINQAVTWYLNTVLAAHGSFKYYDEWDCGCSLEELLAAREAEEKAMEEEENARIARNKAAKAVFDSGEIPESSPLFKKLDSYVDEYQLGLIKVRASCARTTVEVNTEWLQKAFNLPASFNYKSTTSEFTGATTRDAGLTVGVKKEVGNGEVSANLNLSVSVSSDGNGVVKDYSVTAGADAGVSVGNYTASAGGEVKISGDQGGIKDYSVTASANSSVKYGETTVSGGASVSYGSKGLETDFSAKVTQDFSNGVGTEGSASFEASTKRGCSVSGDVNQTINPAGAQVQKDAVEKVKKETGLDLNTDFFKKELWSGKYELKSK
jgi:tetratricopeptide (TPR) repeat protein